MWCGVESVYDVCFGGPFGLRERPFPIALNKCQVQAYVSFELIWKRFFARWFVNLMSAR